MFCTPYAHKGLHVRNVVSPKFRSLDKAKL